jgi:predicted PolB exonuclease-like 3'-5' exonuclease
MVEGVKGLANSFAANMMYGEGDLANFEDRQDFLNKFVARYEEKAMLDVNAAKRDKAQTPQAIARAEQDKQKVLSGLATVKGYFNG